MLPAILFLYSSYSTNVGAFPYKYMYNDIYCWLWKISMLPMYATNYPLFY